MYSGQRFEILQCLPLTRFLVFGENLSKVRKKLFSKKNSTKYFFIEKYKNIHKKVSIPHSFRFKGGQHKDDLRTKKYNERDTVVSNIISDI